MNQMRKSGNYASKLRKTVQMSIGASKEAVQTQKSKMLLKMCEDPTFYKETSVQNTAIGSMMSG